MPRATPLPPEERRALIMAATEELLTRHGVDVSTRQIAEAAGVAEGTIFRVFPSKDALLDAVRDRLFDPEPLLADLAGVDREQPLEARILRVVTLLQVRLRRTFALLHILLADHTGRRTRPEQGRQLQSAARVEEAIAAILAPDRDRLRIPPREAAGLLRALVFATSQPLLGTEVGRNAEQLVDLLLYGISAELIPAPHLAALTPVPSLQEF